MTEWHCEAYGPEGAKFGALCFVQEVGRACAGPEVCHATLTAERERVWHRMRAMAFTGDAVARAMLEDFKGPDDLLNGPGYP